MLQCGIDNYLPDLTIELNHAPAMYCRSCQYELAGLTSDRCPGCGRAFERANLALSPPAALQEAKIKGRKQIDFRPFIFAGDSCAPRRSDGRCNMRIVNCL